MRFDTPPADEAFRQEVRSFLGPKVAELFPEGTGPGGMHSFRREIVRKWTRALSERNWSTPYWPTEHGGADLPPSWSAIWEEETIRAGCPPTDVIGIGFVGPVIYTFGSAEQKRRYLPRIRMGEEFWCQGFSESHAGSDVMSLQTTATQRGTEFLVNGQKLWTSNAHNSDMMFALVRIEQPGVRRSPGLSFLLIDMRSPGLTVRPVITIDGRHWVNEVTLTNVRVPIQNLVGEQGRGWIYARFLLGNERTIVAGVPILRRMVAIAREALTRPRCARSSSWGDHLLRNRLAGFEIELKALEFMELRMLNAGKDESLRQLLSPILKLRATELRQRISEFFFEIAGEEALEFAVRAPGGAAEASDTPTPARMSSLEYLFQRSATIAGGTSEIQRNIIAATALGV